MKAPDTQVIAHSVKAKVEGIRRPDAMVLKFSGVIDEELDFKPLNTWVATFAAGQKVIFDLAGITRMNSCGVRDWILLLERHMPAHVVIEFETVAQLMIEQANMIPNMLGKKGTSILSFQAPYYCQSCKTEEIQVLKTSELKANSSGGFTAPERKCPKCGNALEFDWNEEEYFSFLKR